LSGAFAGDVLAARSGRDQVIGYMPVTCGCPLGTGVVRPIWHAGGTAGEDERAQQPEDRADRYREADAK